MLRGPTIRVPQLKNLLAEKCSKLRLLDVTNTPGKPPYRFFKWLIDTSNQNHPDFVAEHMLGAANFDLDLASHPKRSNLKSTWKRHNLVFYALKHDIGKGDSVVVYGRGGFGGMLTAARAWYMLKVSGVKNVAVLEGGLDKWKEEEEGLESGELPRLGSIEKRDLISTDFQEDFIVHYEDLKFDRLDEVNMLDCRPAEVFGVYPPPFPRRKIFGAPLPGKYLPGSKNVPLSAVIDPNGEMKSEEEIRKVLNVAGFNPSKPTYAMCNDGTQAPLLGLALEKAGVKWSLFDGGLSEVSERNPSLIKVTGEEKKEE